MLSFKNYSKCSSKIFSNFGSFLSKFNNKFRFKNFNNDNHKAWRHLN
jgi:hypothetical protein